MYDELYHAKKGGSRKNHKYIARVKIGSKGGRNVYRYFYTQEEWNQYNKQKESKYIDDEYIKETTYNSQKNEFTLESVPRNPNKNKDAKKTSNRTDKGKKYVEQNLLQKSVRDMKRSFVNNQKKIIDFFKKNKFLSDPIGEFTKFTKNKMNETKRTIDKKIDDTKKGIDRYIDRKIQNAKKQAYESAKEGKKKAIQLGNEGVKKAKKLIEDVTLDKKNIYNVNSFNYKSKIEKIKKSKEWKDIVARKDPEYVRKNADGKTVYLIDEYLVKKKHPVIDVVSDIVEGREISTHEITKDTAVAGLIDYASSTIKMGFLGAAIGSRFLLEKFKLSQGSYDKQIAQLQKDIQRGSKNIKQYVDTANETYETMNQANQLAKVLNTTNKVAKGEKVSAKEVITLADELGATDYAKKVVKDNHQAKQLERIISNMSDEELEQLRRRLNS